MKILKIVAAGFASVVLLAGCGADISAAKEEAVGEWWGMGSSLVINADGTGTVDNTEEPELGNGDFEWKIKGDSFIITYTDQDKQDTCTAPGSFEATSPVMECTGLGMLYKILSE
ncbi:MAG: hypothetical protein FWG15_06020 [Propionibacteriaceae bacterium]|nr:hypothetical protein [Propionibacteriaceae bacterium]